MRGLQTTPETFCGHGAASRYARARARVTSWCNPAGQENKLYAQDFQAERESRSRRRKRLLPHRIFLLATDPAHGKMSFAASPSNIISF